MKKAYILALSLLLPSAALAMKNEKDGSRCLKIEVSYFADDNGASLAIVKKTTRNKTYLLYSSLNNMAKCSKIYATNGFDSDYEKNRLLRELIFLIDHNNMYGRRVLEEAKHLGKSVTVENGMYERAMKKINSEKGVAKEEQERIKFVMDGIETEGFRIKDWKNNFSLPKLLFVCA